MRTKIIRRFRAIAAATVAGTLALSACGTANKTSDDPPTLSNENVTIRLNWWGADARHERTQKAIELFKSEHPNINVVGEFSDWGGYWDKLATSTAGGNSPDVYQMDELYLASYAERGVLLDLDKIDQLDTTPFDKSVLDSGRSNGVLYGMPISSSPYAIIVNNDLLDEYNLTLPDTDTWTWEGYQEFATSITKASKGAVAGTGLMQNVFSLRLYGRQHGEEMFKGTKVTISPETVADYLQMGLDWQASGAARSASAIAEGAGLPLDQSAFSTKKEAMTFAAAAMLPTIMKAAGDPNLTIARLPGPKDDDTKYAYLKPGMYWVISSKTAHPAEAAMLIDFLVNNKEAGKILGTERGIPANPEIRDSLTGLTPPEKASVDFVAALTDTLGDAPEIVPNGASEVETMLSRYEGEVMFERQTPEEAAKAYIAELQAAIDAAQ